MGLSAAGYAALLAPRIGVLPDALLVERTRIITGATEAAAKLVLGLTIPAKTDEHMRAVLTRGSDSQAWYSGRAADATGMLRGDAILSAGISVDRIRWVTGERLVIQNAGGSMADWFTTGPGQGSMIYIATADGAVTLDPADNDSLTATRIRLTTTAAQAAILAAVDTAGDLVNIVIAG